MDAIRLQRLAHWFYSKHIRIIPGILYKWIHFRYSSDISPVTKIGGGTTLGHGGIGVVINSQAIVGINCIKAQNVTLAGKDGGAPMLNNWVYVGANSILLGKVKIGNNAFIGALSLVNKDVPDNAIVAGIPAKVIRYKTEEEIIEWHKWVLTQGGKPIE